MPFKAYLLEAINEKLKEIDRSKTADAKEIMEYLTSVIRKESLSKEIVV